MKTNGSNITDEMLVKYLLGEVSDIEKNQVQQWLNVSSENKNHYNDFKLLWNQSRNLAAHSTTNENEAWERFKERTQLPQQPAKRIPFSPSYKWLRIAAILLLFAGAGGLTYFYATQGKPPRIAVQTIVNTASSSVSSAGNIPAVSESNVTAQVTDPSQTANNTNEKKENTAKRTIAANQHSGLHRKRCNSAADDDKKSKEFICNSTPSPFEICIVQKMKCNNSRRPATISTCSTLEPDQSGQLRYKAFDKINKKCAFTIEEITIKKISTGETVVLTADSRPSTAQDLFNYITGRKKGAILAQSDCNNYTTDDCITIDNNFGDLRLQ